MRFKAKYEILSSGIAILPVGVIDRLIDRYGSKYWCDSVVWDRRQYCVHRLE